MAEDISGVQQSSHTPPQSPILYQNSDKTITLLDIPTSITAAQKHASPLHLLSSPPLESPYPSNEPKSASASAKLAQNTVDADLHAEYANLLTQALEEVKTHHKGQWCLPRLFISSPPPPPQPSHKRKALDYHWDDPTSAPSWIAKDIPSHDANTMKIRDSCFFSNPTHSTQRVQSPPSSIEGSCIYLVPPRATLHQGSCGAAAHVFRQDVRWQAQHMETRAEFDFVLMDPPWPNRSVKRTHRTPGSTYSTAHSLLDACDLILDLGIETMLSEDGLVGLWITNKPAVRDMVLGPNGIFAYWNADLVEEWIWLKTTVHGEPVTALNALWRKPYEVLLLGRKRRKLGTQTSHADSPGLEEPGTSHAPLKRRVIIGVPDLHSRKPCLKSLIEPLMPDGSDYRALEVFARHLVAGWWSWGDECVRFNWEGYWWDAGEQDGLETATGSVRGL